MPLPTLLTSADHPTIRALIRSNLGPSDLSDAIIVMSYTPATQQVVALDPQAGSWPVGSDQATRDHDAAVLFAAAWLMPTVPLIDRETFQGYSYQLATGGMSQIERIEQLKFMAQTLLGVTAGATLTSLQPTMFTLATGRRGDVNDLGEPVSPFRAASTLM